MEQRNGHFNGGFETLVCDEDLHEEAHPHYGQSNKKQVSMFTVRPVRRYRLAAVSLTILAAVLLILNISLGVYYNKLTDTHLTPDDTERISKELADLQDTYKAAVETMKDARKQLDSEMSRQTQTNWELEHQTKRSNDYKSQIETITKETETMRSYLPMISDGCKHCPAGWILMNSVCYYFPFSDNGYKTWKESRDFCQLHGGDLIIINSKDEENSTVNYLINHQDALQPASVLISEHPSFHRFTPVLDFSHPGLTQWTSGRRWVNGPIYPQEPFQNPVGFWIGLRNFHEEGTWKWWDGTFLNEGYWNDGEPNDLNNEDCAAVYPRENFFKAWNDVRCDARMKWICEKAPTTMS